MFRIRQLMNNTPAPFSLCLQVGLTVASVTARQLLGAGASPAIPTAAAPPTPAAAANAAPLRQLIR